MILRQTTVTVDTNNKRQLIRYVVILKLYFGKAAKKFLDNVV